MSTADPSLDAVRQDRGFFVFNAVVSAAALALLSWLLVFRDTDESGALDLRFMPAVNAGLNATAAVLLVAGWLAIRAKKIGLHKRLMVGAFAASTFFLVGYLAYHYVHGDTRYEGEHRGLYLTILFSHVVLSIPVVPMALSAFYFAWKQRFATHKKITRILAPIWTYVSVTGVLVYFFLRSAS
jgi:putative membrane protein